MKSSELHRLILKNGWRSIRQAGSHVIYEKDGKTVSVPFSRFERNGFRNSTAVYPGDGAEISPLPGQPETK